MQLYFGGPSKQPRKEKASFKLGGLLVNHKMVGERSLHTTEVRSSAAIITAWPGGGGRGSLVNFQKQQAHSGVYRRRPRWGPKEERLGRPMEGSVTFLRFRGHQAL